MKWVYYNRISGKFYSGGDGTNDGELEQARLFNDNQLLITSNIRYPCMYMKMKLDKAVRFNRKLKLEKLNEKVDEV